jgi:hypothetical protein
VQLQSRRTLTEIVALRVRFAGKIAVVGSANGAAVERGRRKSYPFGIKPAWAEAPRRAHDKLQQPSERYAPEEKEAVATKLGVHSHRA